MDRFYLGTEPKYTLTVNSTGFDMNRDTWSATIKNGKNSVVCKPGSGAIENDGQWYIVFDTADLGADYSDLYSLS